MVTHDPELAVRAQPLPFSGNRTEGAKCSIEMEELAPTDTDISWYFDLLKRGDLVLPV